MYVSKGMVVSVDGRSRCGVINFNPGCQGQQTLNPEPSAYPVLAPLQLRSGATAWYIPRITVKMTISNVHRTT